MLASVGHSMQWEGSGGGPPPTLALQLKQRWVRSVIFWLGSVHLLTRVFING